MGIMRLQHFIILGIVLSTALTTLSNAFADEKAQKQLKELQDQLNNNCSLKVRLDLALFGNNKEAKLASKLQSVRKDPSEQICPVENPFLERLKANHSDEVLRVIIHDPVTLLGNGIVDGANCAPEYNFVFRNIKGVTDPMNDDNISLDFDSLKNAHVVSLGEGDGRLVAYLALNGVDAYGVDLINSYDRKIFNLFKDRLLKSDATKLTKLKISQKPFDLVISTSLLCDTGYDVGKEILSESIRALKPGGESRHFFNSYETVNPSSPEFAEMLRMVRKQAEKDGIKIKIYTIGFNPTTINRNDADRDRGHLLIIKRIN